MNTNPPPEIYPTPDPVSDPGKGFSIAALVLGILSLVFAWFYIVGIFALAMGIVGIVLAIQGRKKTRAAGLPNGLGTAGLVLSIVGTAISGVSVLCCTICVSCFQAIMNY